MTWVHGGPIHVSCDLDISLFPFDKQNCYFIMESWAYNYEEIKLLHHSKIIHRVQYVEHSEWSITSNGTAIDYNNEDKLAAEYPSLLFELSLQRKPAYYIVNVLVPSVFLNILVFCGFWLPSKSGERLSFSKSIFFLQSKSESWMYLIKHREPVFS